LRASIALYNGHRRLLQSLSSPGQASLSAFARWHLTNAAMLIPPEEFPGLLSAVAGLPVLAAGQGRRRLLLSGATLDDPEFIALIENLGASVVGDDLCNGERYCDTLASEQGDPWEALADRYLNRVPCPCKHAGLDARIRHLTGLAAERRAQGVIFVLKKYCDPHAWDYPPLAEALKAAGVPSLLLETEATTPLEAMRTRVEAFLEMMG
jgi:benzoyl-CoA reductase/2-hydroxyglutaryl-CoA dehydratase subunit BcrC/BadD/HgdB